MNAGFYLLLSKNTSSMPITKQIIVFLTVGIASALVAMAVATIVIGVTTKKEENPEEEEQTEEGESEENNE